ncbi:MAG: hypothetical protein J6J23_02655, partial [Clostridia bacterium]|nr:hypothetical protein [Clostridia bacterium]
MTKNNQHYKNEGRGEIPFRLLSKKRLITIALAGAVVTTPLIFTGCADGKDGVNGADGTIWKSGTSYTEFSDAKVGDYFIDTDDYILYQKTTDSWSIVMENYGKQGNSANAPVIEINADGYWTIDGVETTIKATGENGTKWHSGVVAPTTEGDVGDYYLCTENYDIYEKYDNGWTKIGNIESSNA